MDIGCDVITLTIHVTFDERGDLIIVQPLHVKSASDFGELLGEMKNLIGDMMPISHFSVVRADVIRVIQKTHRRPVSRQRSKLW